MEKNLDLVLTNVPSRVVGISLEVTNLISDHCPLIVNLLGATQATKTSKQHLNIPKRT